MEEEREVEKNKWLDFNAKVCYQDLYKSLMSRKQKAS
jgi:hypothetical protein